MGCENIHCIPVEWQPAHSSSSCTVCLVFTPIHPLFLFLCIFPLPLNAWKLERWKKSAWVELLYSCWAMGAAVRKSPPCSEELAGVSKLLRFLEVARNKVEMQGVKSIRKLGRRGMALIWSYGRSLGANASTSKGVKLPVLPISQVWVRRGEVSCQKKVLHGYDFFSFFTKWLRTLWAGRRTILPVKYYILGTVFCHLGGAPG